MDDTGTTIQELRRRNAALEAENERLRSGTGFSRKQLLMGSAGVVGAVAGAGFLSGGRPAEASTGPRSGLHTLAATTGVSLFLQITGQKQGPFTGDSLVDRRHDWITVLFVDYEVMSPRDLATGQSSGKRQHKPFTIVKEWGAASPQIYQAVATNENLTSVVFEVVKSNADGVSTVLTRIKLANAAVSDFHPFLSDTSDRHSDVADKLLIEQVSFTFQKISWTYLPGNRTFDDSWS